MASITASALAVSCSAEKDRLPIGTCTLPALSTRNSTLPAFASRTARAMSNVTVPSLGFGIRPRGPSTLPSRPTCPMRSGVAMVVSKSMKPPWTRSTRSSAPTTSAPASRASFSFSPLANTATRTLLPVPWGSTTAPRTIWSACLGSTPRRKERSTDSSNFVPGMDLRSAIASSTVYSRSGSIFAAAASYRLPVRFVTTVAMSSLLADFDAHAAGGALDDPHGGVDRVRVQIRHLRLRDLPDLLPGDLADLLLERVRRRLRDAGRSLEQHRRRWGLHHERERPILVDRDHDREDQALLALRLGVVALAELHDVDAVLPERRPHRRRGIGLAGGGLQLDDCLNLLHREPLIRASPPGSTRAPPAWGDPRPAPPPSCGHAR